MYVVFFFPLNGLLISLRQFFFKDLLKLGAWKKNKYIPQMVVVLMVIFIPWDRIRKNGGGLRFVSLLFEGVMFTR